MLIYHYPGLEAIDNRRGHWELKLPFSRLRQLYPRLRAWPFETLSVEEYVERRERLTCRIGVEAFLHFWYFLDTRPIWDETAKFICGQQAPRIPIALVWCWKTPHETPLNKCLPHRVDLRCTKRETIRTMSDLDAAIDYLAAHYMKSSNYLKFDGRPVLLFYHVEGWNSMCASHRSPFVKVRRSFENYDIDPYLIGISVSKVDEWDENLFFGLNAVTRYNDLPDFDGPPRQKYRMQVKRYVSDWSAIYTLLQNHHLSFMPSVSVGWNATLRYSGNDAHLYKHNRYPLLPVVESPKLDDVLWAINKARDFAAQTGTVRFTVCAWNEWTENAALEYFLEHVMESDSLGV
jgi:hypothetical protein